MSANKNPQNRTPATVSDAQVDRLIYEALRADGKFVPQTPEEVAAAEAELNEAAVELPAGLRNPYAVLGGTFLTEPATGPALVDGSVAENLGCAARLGKSITPDILAQMDRDEEAAGGAEHGDQ
jgi:hypothetical protein